MILWSNVHMHSQYLQLVSLYMKFGLPHLPKCTFAYRYGIVPMLLRSCSNVTVRGDVLYYGHTHMVAFTDVMHVQQK